MTADLRRLVKKLWRCSKYPSLYTRQSNYMYSADLADKAAEHDINFHGYADDTQLCVHCRPVSHVMRSINVRYLLTYLLYFTPGLLKD